MIKTKERISEYGEVFTSEREVQAMLNLVEHETQRIDARFLEPACGNGNFLIEVLRSKLKIVIDRFYKIQSDFEKYSILAISNIYGIDILEDNVDACRQRLFKQFEKIYRSLFTQINDDVLSAVIFVLSLNITYGNTLTFKLPNSEKPVVFPEWGFTTANFVKLTDYTFSNLLTFQLINNQIREKIKNMKFDVIIGNPPYQLETGGSNRQATPIYNKFIEQARKLNPRYITMIIPARWYVGGMGLNNFRKKMISDKRIKELHDFPVTSDCFPEINIRGGVCYFLWDRDYEGKCDVYNWNNGKNNKMQRYLNEYGKGVFLRYNSAISILSKVQKLFEPTFERYVSSQKPFGLPTNFSEYSEQRTSINNIELYKAGAVVFTSKAKITNGEEILEKYKIFIGKASPGSDTFPHLVISKPIIGNPGSACTETYLALYKTKDVDEINNVASYLQTKFAKFMILMMKPTQDVLKKSYSLLPVQNFSKPIADNELFHKYRITNEEIIFINSLVK